MAGGRAAAVLETPDLPAGTASGTAESAAGGGSRHTAAACPGYQDADGDGLCDYYGTGRLHHPEHGSGISPSNPGYNKGNGPLGSGRGCGHHGGSRR